VSKSHTQGSRTQYCSQDKLTETNSILSQIFCYWDKQRSANSNFIQFHLTLNWTKTQSSHFCDSFLVSKLIFQHHDRCLAEFHAGVEQPLVCVVINNSSYPAVKNNNPAYHAFGIHWMQSRGFPNYRLKYFGQKESTVYVDQTNLNRKLRKKLRTNQKSVGTMAHPVPLRIAPE